MGRRHDINSYLFLWNPIKDPYSFTNFKKTVKEADKGNSIIVNWICPSKKPKNGDCAIIQRTGTKNNGIFAKGFIIKEAHLSDDGTQIVKIELKEFLNLGDELSRESIISLADYKDNWAPQSSGNLIPDAIIQAMNKLWKEKRTAKL